MEQGCKEAAFFRARQSSERRRRRARRAARLRLRGIPRETQGRKEGHEGAADGTPGPEGAAEAGTGRKDRGES